MATTESRPPVAPAGPSAPPALAEGIDLVGEFQDSGFEEAPYIVRRADGQTIQLPRMLYLVAEQIDGRRDVAEIAEAASHATGRGISPAIAQTLIDERLRPLGLLAEPGGAQPEVEKADPLLALKFRTAVVPERFTRALTTVFRPLFLSPVVVVVVAGMIALDGWLLFEHGIAQSVRQALYNPALLLALLGGVVLATAFHEIGHATACRYGGAEPGVMGVGIYVVWPAFYTDVTDAYRLGKAGRLRTDLGGIYFNAVFALATAGAYFVTGYEPLLLLVLLQNFAMVQQLMPFLRLDGYYIISDLTGVPDMLTRIKPILQSLVPGRKPSDRVTELKPWVRVVVTAYICLLVPVLLGLLALMLLHAPRVFATAYDSVGVQWEKVTGDGGLLTRTAGVVQSAMLVLPCAGMVLTSGRIGNRLTGAAWRWSAGAPARRAALGAGLAAALGLAAFTWWPNGDYRPIQPGERGTLPSAAGSVLDVPSGRPALTPERERELGGAPTERERREEGRVDDEPFGVDLRERTPTEDEVTRDEPRTSTAPAAETPATETAPTETTPAPADAVPETQQTVPVEPDPAPAPAPTDPPPAAPVTP